MALEQPVVYWRESWQQPRPVQFHFLRVDLKNAAYEVIAMVAEDPDGDGPAEAQLTSPVELAQRHRAAAAVNANAFRALSNTDGKADTKWFGGKPVDIVGVAVSGHVVRSWTEKERDSFWIDGSGTAHIGNPVDKLAVAQGVSDWGSRLLVDGKSSIATNAPIHPRTLLGLDKDARFLLLAVADGRQPGYSEGISLLEAAEVMKEHGCHNAINLDGGGSSIMVISDGERLKVVNRPPADPRPIPVMLGIRRASEARRRP